jgi:hypothetical protein
MNHPHVYHISSGYRKATCWCGDSTGRRVCVSTTTPDKGLIRAQRYEVIYGWLREHFDIIGPPYYPKGTP